MENVTAKADNKHQIELSDVMREKLGFPAGVKISMIRHGKSVTLTPIPPMEEMRGIIKGAAVDFSKIRDKQDKYQ